MKTFTFRYFTMTNSLSIDNFTVSTKNGRVKKEFPVANIINFYVLNTQQYQSMYMTYTDNAGKRKKIVLFAALGEMGFMEMVTELKMRMPEKSLHLLSQKEAFAAMKVANPNKWAPIVAFLLIVGIFGIFLFPGFIHFFDGGHENVTVEQVVAGDLGTRNVTIEGDLLDAGTEETVSGRKSGTTHSTFIPIVDENWQEGDPVKVVLKFKELSSFDYTEAMDRHSFTGVIRNVWWEGIEKDKVDFFKSEFGLHFEGTPILIEVTGKEAHNDAWSLIVFGIVAVIMAGVLTIVAIRKNKG